MGEIVMTEHEHDSDDRGGNSPGRWVLIGFLAIGGFFLIAEHRAHVFGVLPYLLLLACPLMHFLRGGHGGHSHRNDLPQDAKSRDSTPGHEPHQQEQRKGGQP